MNCEGQSHKDSVPQLLKKEESWSTIRPRWACLPAWRHTTRPPPQSKMSKNCLFPVKLASDRFVFVPSGLALVGSPQRRRLTTQPKNASGTSSDWEKWGGSVDQHVRARACVLWNRIVGPQLPIAVYSQLPTSGTQWILCLPWVACKSSTAVSLRPIWWWCPMSGHLLLVPL